MSVHTGREDRLTRDQRILAWATDVHLNFVSRHRVERFCDEIAATGAQALLLGGDIAEAIDLEDWLHLLEEKLQRPIYFVLGNHDYYAGDVATVEGRMASLLSPWLRYLPAAGPIALTETVGLVGHGGWGDARHGNFLASEVQLSDYVLIRDLRESSGSDDPLAVLEHRPALQRKLQELGDAAAHQLGPALRSAMVNFPEVLVLTHVPPFREAAWFQGSISNDDWLPGMTCKAIGDLLIGAAEANPGCRLRVLCGHTHWPGEAVILPNLVVTTQGASYGEPRFRLLSFPA